MGVSDQQPVYVIYDRTKEVIGVVTGFKKAMRYVYDNREKGFTWKEFRINELI